MFFFYFMCFFNVVLFVVVITKTYKITNMMHFSWTERVFCSSIIDFI